MKKIGIITIHRSPNYGACLQSYALWQYISSLGHSCEIIDLLRPAHSEFIPSLRYKPYSQDSGLRMKIALKKILKIFLKGTETKGNNYSRLPLEQKCLEQRFNEFNAPIKMSIPFRQIDELYENPPLYDIYITGSDQLWNPTQPYCLEPYFLNFAPKDKMKLSYATSIGLEELPDKIKYDFSKWLPSYEAISVREKEAKEILKEIVDKEIEVVADPTFLIDIAEWEMLAIKPDIKEKYLFLFTLHPDAKLLNYAIKLKNETGYRLVVCTNVPGPRNDQEYSSILDAGPKEFLGWIANAEMVITDSFHGTVFSVLLGAKNFYSYIPNGNRKGSRIRHLLQIFSLGAHLLDNTMAQSYKDLTANIVDKDVIMDIALQEQKRSRDFLEKYLK